MIKETVTYTSRKHEEKQETAFIVAIKISPFLSSVALPDGERATRFTNLVLPLFARSSFPQPFSCTRYRYQPPPRGRIR